MTTSTNPNTLDADGLKSAMRSQWDQAVTGWNAHAAQIRAWPGPATSRSTSRDYLDFPLASANPIQQILDRLNAAAAAAAWTEMEEGLEAFVVEGGWEGPNELLLTAGTC